MPLDLKEFVKRHETYGDKNYSASELHELCSKSIEAFKKEPTMLKIDPPVAVAGNFEGCFYGAIRFCELYECHKPAGGGVKKKLFIGNYTGSTQPVEAISSVLGLKLRYPDEVFVLRGSDERLDSYSNVSDWMWCMQKQLTERFGKDEAEKLLLHLNEVYSWMPLAALVGGKIFCVNKGIPPQLKSLEEIQKIPRPLVDPSKNNLAKYLLDGQLFREDDFRKSLRDFGLSKMIIAEYLYSGMHVDCEDKLYTISGKCLNEDTGAAIFIDKEAFQPVTYSAVDVTYEGKHPKTYRPDPVRDPRYNKTA